MVFDKFIMIKEKQKITCGQTAAGMWYCKELAAETSEELNTLIGEVNKVLNIYNSEEKKK